MLNSVGYIDAGSGSYLLAAIASGAAGSWFFLRSKFAQLRGRGPNKTASQEATSDSATDSTTTAPADQDAKSRAVDGQ
jgi:hypothetical protein